MQGATYASFGNFISLDIVEVFAHAAYEPTENSIKLLCKLKAISKAFRSTVTRQLSNDKKWLGVLAEGEDTFREQMPAMLHNGLYGDFFAGMGTFRFISQVQHDGLGVFLKHSVAEKGANRSRVVVAAMEYHRSDVTIQRFGCAVLLKLLKNEAVPKEQVLQEVAVVVEALVASPKDINLQFHAIMCLKRLTENMAALPPTEYNQIVKKISNVGQHDLMSYVVYRMILNRKDETFQGDALMLLVVLSPYQVCDLEKAALAAPDSAVGIITARGMGACIVDTMRIFKHNTKIQEHGCVVLAHMALNNLANMTHTAKCVVHIINSMQATGSTTLHATAMVSITALCIDAFCFDSKLSRVHRVHQNNFSSAGLIPMMLSSLNEYAKTSATWAMKVLCNVISGLDSMCLQNASNTGQFLRGNGINILVKAVFRSNNSIAPLINFKDESWMGMFEMIEHILLHRCAGPDDSAASHMFINILDHRYATVHGKGRACDTKYSLTQIVLMAVRGNTIATTSVAFMEISLRILALCLKHRNGFKQMSHTGVGDILELMCTDKIRRGNRPSIQAGCLKLLTLLIAKDNSLALKSGVLELALADKHSLTPISAECGKNTLMLRTTVVRMQTLQCAEAVLAMREMTVPSRNALLETVLPLREPVDADSYDALVVIPHAPCFVCDCL